MSEEQAQDTQDNSDLHSDAVTEEISSAMDFDPFGPENSEEVADEAFNDVDSAQSSEEAEGDTADGSGDDAGQPAMTDTTGQQSEDGSQANPDLQEYIKQNQELLKQVMSGKSEEGKQTKDSADDAQEVDPWTHVPSYNYNVPDQLVEMIGSEDPSERKQAVSYLVKGVAQGIHQQIMSTVGSQVKNLQQNIPQTVQQMQQTQAVQQQVATDFYGKYPQFNDPNILPIVQNVAEQVLQETGKQSWDNELRDEIGKRVTGILSKVAGGNQPQNKAPKKPVDPPATFQNGGASSRGSGVNTKPTTQQDHIIDIMN